MLTQQQLKEQLHYDPATGDFRWLVRRNGMKESVGTVHHKGYLNIGIARRYYGAHRLAWLYMTGELPTQFVDHKNRVRSDNRWDNLRLLDRAGNRQNCNTNRNNTSGEPGVYFQKSSGLWLALITANGQRLYLGCFRNKEDAITVRRTAKSKLHIS